MADLVFSRSLNLSGTLKLAADGGGKVKVGNDAMLVVSGQPTGKAKASVIQPPPPTGPLNTGLDVTILLSFNSTVTVNDKPVVTQGICQQGNTPPIWPGMVLTSTKNSSVKINAIPINVVGDTGVTLPNGGTVDFNNPDNSGQ